MDHVLVFFAAVTAAFAAGTVVAEWRHRARLMRMLEAAQTKLTTTTTDIATAHNGLAKQLLAMQEQINSHEFKLGGMAQKASTPWASHKAADLVRQSP